MLLTIEYSLHLSDSVQYLTVMSQTTPDAQTWPDLAIGLYDKLTGRGAEITYEFQSMEIAVPSSASATAQHATWRVSGTVKIRTKDDKTTAHSYCGFAHRTRWAPPEAERIANEFYCEFSHLGFFVSLL